MPPISWRVCQTSGTRSASTVAKLKTATQQALCGKATPASSLCVSVPHAWGAGNGVSQLAFLDILNTSETDEPPPENFQFFKLSLILNGKDRFLTSNVVINLITGISLLQLKIEMGH